MNPRPGGKTQTGNVADARARLAIARKYLEVAHVAASESDESPEARNVAGALAVLAGIAAADAACFAALGLRSRSQNHRDAIALLEQITPGGAAAARHLARLLDLKDAAQYGIISLSSKELKEALRAADALETFTIDVVRRKGGTQPRSRGRSSPYTRRPPLPFQRKDGGGPSRCRASRQVLTVTRWACRSLR